MGFKLRIICIETNLPPATVYLLLYLYLTIITGVAEHLVDLWVKYFLFLKMYIFISVVA